jgi:ABC-2 type transport system ATP-binding protein
MIVLNNVFKHFGPVRALDGLTLNVPAGEIFGLIGPNGAGKTTTIRILAGLIRPDAGTVQLDGCGLEEHRKIRRMTGALIEQPGLYGKLSLLEYLRFFSRLYDLPPARSRERIRTLIDLLELDEWKQEKLRGFSLGMKQKVALARILLHDPPILLLDEPTAGLDPLISKKVRDYLLENTGRKKTVLVSTHNLDEASRFCDAIAIIKDGRILDAGSWEALRTRHASRGVITVRVLEVPEVLETTLRRVPGVRDVRTDRNRKTLSYATDDIPGTNPVVVQRLCEAGASILSVEGSGATLEQAYLRRIGSDPGDPP